MNLFATITKIILIIITTTISTEFTSIITATKQRGIIIYNSRIIANFARTLFVLDFAMKQQHQQLYLYHQQQQQQQLQAQQYQQDYLYYHPYHQYYITRQQSQHYSQILRYNQANFKINDHDYYHQQRIPFSPTNNICAIPVLDRTNRRNYCWTVVNPDQIAKPTTHFATITRTRKTMSRNNRYDEKRETNNKLSTTPPLAFASSTLSSSLSSSTSTSPRLSSTASEENIIITGLARKTMKAIIPSKKSKDTSASIDIMESSVSNKSCSVQADASSPLNQFLRSELKKKHRLDENLMMNDCNGLMLPKLKLNPHHEASKGTSGPLPLLLIAATGGDKNGTDLQKEQHTPQFDIPLFAPKLSSTDTNKSATIIKDTAEAATNTTLSLSAKLKSLNTALENLTLIKENEFPLSLEAKRHTKVKDDNKRKNYNNDKENRNAEENSNHIDLTTALSINNKFGDNSVQTNLTISSQLNDEQKNIYGNTSSVENIHSQGFRIPNRKSGPILSTGGFGRLLRPSIEKPKKLNLYHRMKTSSMQTSPCQLDGKKRKEKTDLRTGENRRKLNDTSATFVRQIPSTEQEEETLINQLDNIVSMYSGRPTRVGCVLTTFANSNTDVTCEMRADKNWWDKIMTFDGTKIDSLSMAKYSVKPFQFDTKSPDDEILDKIKRPFK